MDRSCDFKKKETCFLHISTPLSVLNFSLPNEAIQLMWLHRYLNFSKHRSTWAYIADFLIRKATKAADRNVDLGTRINMFIQNWEMNMRDQKYLPTRLIEMLNVAKKHGVRIDTLKAPKPLRLKFPIWYHIGADPKLARITRSQGSTCLRRTHGVTTVEDVINFTKRLTTPSIANGEFVRHSFRKNCRCPPCRLDWERGCRDPDQCSRTALELKDSIYPKLAPDFLTLKDNLSLTRRRIKKNAKAREENTPITFDPSTTDHGDIMDVIRAFTNDRTGFSKLIPPPRIPSNRPGTVPRSVTVYTDGSSSKNGHENSRVGSGVWFGHNDPRNASLRIDIPGANNQTGKLVAILVAAQRAPRDANLHIISDSMYVIDGLTLYLDEWENRGWIGVKNKKLFQAIVTTLRKRSTVTTFLWTKGHTGTEGNEMADQLAAEGAGKDQPDEIDLKINQNYILSGCRLAKLTQVLAYRGIIERQDDPPRRGSQ